MRILIIDYLTYHGHRNFNKIHVESLMRQGHWLDIVGRESALGAIEKNSYIELTYLPKWASRSFPMRVFSERIKNITTLLWIKKHFNLENYNFIVFLAYDIVSFSFFRTKQPVIVINHNNVAQLNSFIKRLLTQWLPNRVMHIVLTKDSEERLNSLLKGKSITFIPHGFVDDKGKTARPGYLESGERFLFCPINSNYNEGFVKRLFGNEAFLHYLSEKRIRLVAKSKLIGGLEHDRVIGLERRIPEKEYRYLLQEAIAVVLPYDDNFKYRTSGILFECIAVGTPVIARSIDAMKTFQRHIQIRLFNDEKTFIVCIDKYNDYRRIDVNTDIFKPDVYWKSLLEKQKR